MPYKSLSKADILRALRRLGELAQAKGLTLEVALYGGAVFTVVYGYHQFFPRDEISEQNSLTIEAILEKVRSS